MRNVSFWKPSKFAFGVLDADDYIIQSDAVIHEVTSRQNNFPALAHLPNRDTLPLVRTRPIPAAPPAGQRDCSLT